MSGRGVLWVFLLGGRWEGGRGVIGGVGGIFPFCWMDFCFSVMAEWRDIVMVRGWGGGSIF